jgi:hypothetical protein
METRARELLESRTARRHRARRAVGLKETWGPQTNRTLDELSLKMSLDSVVPQTLSRYESAWRHWCLFCERRIMSDGSNHGPWLHGEDTIRDEQLIKDFIAYEGIMANDGAGWTVGTVRNKLAAIRFKHIHNHLPDPTTGNPRIKSCLRVLTLRRREPTQIKLPVTVEVIRAVMITVRADEKISPRDREVIIASIFTAWFYLLRSSEYCEVGGEIRDYCLRVGDVEFYDELHNVLDWSELHRAHSMSLAIRGSKTDQARTGCVRTLDTTGLPVDAVRAVSAMLQSRNLKKGEGLDQPLFQLSSGKAVSNTQVTGALRAAAISRGLDPLRYATHSLRRGGATAMAAAGFPTEVIRRWGRWLSDTWKRYVFGTAEELSGLSRNMVEAHFTLAMVLEDFQVSRRSEVVSSK